MGGCFFSFFFFFPQGYKLQYDDASCLLEADFPERYYIWLGIYYLGGQSSLLQSFRSGLVLLQVIYAKIGENFGGIKDLRPKVWNEEGILHAYRKFGIRLGAPYWTIEGS